MELARHTDIEIEIINLARDYAAQAGKVAQLLQEMNNEKMLRRMKNDKRLRRAITAFADASGKIVDKEIPNR